MSGVDDGLRGLTGILSLNLDIDLRSLQTPSRHWLPNPGVSGCEKTRSTSRPLTPSTDNLSGPLEILTGDGSGTGSSKT